MDTGEPIPKERSRTLRQQLRGLLKEKAFTAAELSRETGYPEKDVYEDLDTLLKTGDASILPAECRSCGHVFGNRSRASKPGKCPRCRNTRIRPPAFAGPQP